MEFKVSVKPFTLKTPDGQIINYERICVNGMPLKPMYEKDKGAYRYLIELIKQGKEDK